MQSGLSVQQNRTQWLDHLFTEIAPPGRLEIRSFGKDGQRYQTFARDQIEALHAIDADCKRGCNVYAGMATRGERVSDETGRISGGKDNLVACRALWVDKDGLYAEGAREEWECALEQFPLQPSMRVDSGNGEHCYWILEEPFEFDRCDMLQLEYALKGLADLLACDPAATDASRILRVPGTFNLPTPDKMAAGRTEMRCRILSTTGALYQFEDFEAFVQRGAALKAQRPSTTASSGIGKFAHPHRHEALTRHATFLRKSGLSQSAIEAALSVFNAERCDPPKLPAEVAALAKWSGRVEVGDNNAQEHEPRIRPNESRADRMRRELAESMTCGRPLERMTIDLGIQKLAPRYPSTIELLETYGNTILMADAGLGKSMLALAIAIETAGTGMWNVVYNNAELDAAEMSTRIGRVTSAMASDSGYAMEAIEFFSAGDQTTIAELAQRAVDAVRDDRRLLIVLDSINTLAEYAADDAPCADLMQARRLYNWAAQVRKNTCGDVSFLIVSETNASGGVKGRKGQFSADVVVRISGTNDSDRVEINCLKSRSAASGPLGVFTRDWKIGRFVK